ncbi:hypothetical protein LPJ60_006132 [Coemansia sp. RSA 2675]|nr:hypothetical protein LPJ60_006132 [Coemansia sp. RSA 2675]
MQLFAELGTSNAKTMSLPTADDGTVYHSVSQGGADEQQGMNDDMAEGAHGRTHVIFSADDNEYIGDDGNSFENSGFARHSAGMRGRNAGYGASPRASAEIELSPMR